MKAVLRLLVVASLVAAAGGASAGPRYYGPPSHHGYYRGGAGWGGLFVGLALAVPLIALANQADRGPDVVYLPPPPVAPPQVVYAQPLPQPQPAYTPSSRPAPVIYPRNGQSNAQLESDSRECNRWATTQQAAMADAGVFQRAVEACMDGRGYTLR